MHWLEWRDEWYGISVNESQLQGSRDASGKEGREGSNRIVAARNNIHPSHVETLPHRIRVCSLYQYPGFRMKWSMYDLTTQTHQRQGQTTYRVAIY